jgi:immune inhibitor A
VLSHQIPHHVSFPRLGQQVPELCLEIDFMRRHNWWLILGIGLPLVLCLYLALCGVTGFVLGRTASTQADLAEPVSDAAPTPLVTPTARHSLPAEWETARTVAQTVLPERDLLDLGYRLQGLPKPLAWQPAENPPIYQVGDTRVFWVHDVQANDYFTTTAALRYATPHAYWWIEEGYDVPERDLERSALNFEEITYPTSRQLFGSEWTPGVDGDPRIYIYLGYVPGVGGYFSGPDEYPVQVRPHSNEHEMFYINLDNAMPGNDYFDGILAHEFQHMIHWAEDRNERTWVNEGLSELAAQVSGYDVGGSDYVFSLTPDTQLTTWTELEDSGPHYGASYLFLAYFLEQFGEEAIRRLVAEPADSIAGFEALLSDLDPDRAFQDLFADWLIANYLDDWDLEAGRYGYKDLEVEPPAHAARYRSYPVQQQATVHQYAADYILLEGEGDYTVEFTGTQIVPLVGNETHGGQFQWWSGRGDEGDATLTRTFDLTGLESATLQAWMWYDLETDYDYAYVEVSIDGGETWDLLANENTTNSNPSGNSYGPAFTGFSGGGEQAVWSQETFDLTPYAGRPLLVRFEVITDEALDHPGLAVDDISIPELGYTDGVEESDGGWQAAGWMRVTDHVPQEFLVQLITFDRVIGVERIPLDEQMHGTVTITGLGQELDRAVLVVSALAPATTEWAAYSYRIAPE